MQLYMACLKENSSTSTPCRNLSRDYLDCRMSKYVCRTALSVSQDTLLILDVSRRGLMEKDEWKNLGLVNLDNDVVPAVKVDNTTPTATSEMPADKKL